MTGPLLLTPGEPAGIGPELACRLAIDDPAIVLVADPGLIERTLGRLGLSASVQVFSDPAEKPAGIRCLPIELASEEMPGRLDKGNAGYVLECLKVAGKMCLAGQAAAMVTGPVHKGVINDAGVPFSGHTEFLAELAGVGSVVMMLAAGSLRVALATTHLPLRLVPDAITVEVLTRVLEITAREMSLRFGISDPTIAVLGLNPHAGEHGHLGDEEIRVIEPVLKELRAAGMKLIGPLPADTAFVPKHLSKFDAVVAMYHDQGLPVLKHAGFGHAVNVTLGLPFVRTSVDHGTALDLAGSGRADAGSLAAAVKMARLMAQRSS